MLDVTEGLNKSQAPTHVGGGMRNHSVLSVSYYLMVGGTTPQAGREAWSCMRHAEGNAGTWAPLE